MPPTWSTEQLRADADRAKDIFRLGRLGETLDVYNTFYDTYAPVVERVVRRVRGLAAWSPATLADLLADERTRRTLCYLTAPPISEDDLKTVADTTLAPTRIGAEPARAERLRTVVSALLDGKRFPWVAEARRPTKGELAAAVSATTALIAASKVQTERRNGAMTSQEGAVKARLEALGFAEVPVRPIAASAQGPAPGQFMGETSVAGSQGDVIVGLRDGRMLIVECKVSNSALNSRKRLLHDTGGKATAWYAAIGTANIVVVGVLRGVFGVDVMEAAQNKGVSLIWDHGLDVLDAFVAATGGSGN